MTPATRAKRTGIAAVVPRVGARRKTQGVIKRVADATTNEVLGVSRVGESAGALIHKATMVLHFRAMLQDVIALLHEYPPMAEALSPDKAPRKLSCCAE